MVDLQDALLHAARQPHAILWIPHELRNPLVSELVDLLDLRAAVVWTLPRYRQLWPRTIRFGCGNRGDRILRNYALARPKIPLRLYYRAIVRELLHVPDLVVADVADHWSPRLPYWKSTFAFKLHAPRKLLFTNCPFRNPPHFNALFRWIGKPLPTNWRHQFLILGPRYIPVGFQNANQLLQLVNPLLYPKLDLPQLQTLADQWIQRRRIRHQQGRFEIEKLSQNEIQQLLQPPLVLP